MTIRVTPSVVTAPKFKALAREGTTPTPAPVKAAETPKEQPGALASIGQFLETSGVTKKISEAINAKSSDEVVAAVTAGVAQLIVERTRVGDLDKKLHDDYKGTITAHVKNATAQKALLVLGEVFGDKVASNLVSAGIGSLSGTMMDLVKDDQFRKMYSEDPKAFGLELAKRGGKNFGIALAAAWGTAKLEEWLPAGFKWLAEVPFISSILKKLSGN